MGSRRLARRAGCSQQHRRRGSVEILRFVQDDIQRKNEKPPKEWCEFAPFGSRQNRQQGCWRCEAQATQAKLFSTRWCANPARALREEFSRRWWWPIFGARRSPCAAGKTRRRGR